MTSGTSPPTLKRKRTRTRTTTNTPTINKQLESIRKILNDIRDQNTLLRRDNETLKEGITFLKSRIRVLEEQNQNMKETIIQNNSCTISSLETKVKEYAEVVSDGRKKENSAGKNGEMKLLKNDLNDLKQTVTENFTRVFREVGTNRKNVNEKLSYANIVSSNLATDTNETKKVIDTMKNSVANLQQNISDKLEEEKEEKRRNNKKLNVCVFNIPEPAENSTASPEDQDVMKLKATLENKIVIEQKDLTAIYRIGKKETNNIKPRPIIIRFSSMDKRTEILSLRDLNYETNNSSVIKVFIAPDRTKKQLEEHKKQHKVRRERQSTQQGSSD